MRGVEDEEDIVLTIFSNLNLRSIIILYIKSLGDLFSCLPSTLPNLEKLVLSGWLWLSNQGLNEILNRSRRNLTVLDLSRSNITGVGVEEGVNSLSNLEVLNLSWCLNLTDGGLKEVLRVSGSKLRVLGVSYTYITGQGFKDGVSLPMLEELDLGGYRQLTYSGLLEILSISVNRLKNMLVTRRISTAYRMKLSSQYPSVQFYYL